MTQRPQVNLELMQKAVKKRPKFERILKSLSTRGRGRQDTSFRALMRELETKDGAGTWTFDEVAEFFDLAADAGAGIIVGDRVNGSATTTGERTPRFLWSVHLQSFALAVLGKKEPVRKRKDGSVIQTEGLRTPTPPRRIIPKLEDLEDSWTPSVSTARVPSRLPTGVAQLFREFLSELKPEALTPAANRKLSEILLLLAK